LNKNLLKSILGRRLKEWRERDARLGTWRLSIFFGGFALVAVLVLAKVPGATPIAILLALAFLVLVVWNSISHRYVEKYTAYDRLMAREDARRELDWDRLPPLPAADTLPNFPRYFYDLDVWGEKSLLRLIHSAVSNSGLAALVGLFSDAAVSREEILRRQALVKELHRKRVFRRKMRLSVTLGRETYLDLLSIESLLQGSLHSPAAPRWVLALSIFQGLTIALLIGFVLRLVPPVFAIPWGISFLIFTLAAREFYNPFGRAVSLEKNLSGFSRIAEVLENHRANPSGELSNLLAVFQQSEKPSVVLKRVSRFVSLLSVRAHPLVYILLNVFLPWDYAITLRLEKLRARLSAIAPKWIRALSEIDAFSSLAEFADIAPGLTYPEIVDPIEGHPVVEAQGFGHPLIPAARRVTNSFKLGKSTHCLLVTGSNMSGKSTFLRTVGINFVLARSGGPVVASEGRFSTASLHTALRLADSLQDQVSSFYAEVKELKEILVAAQGGSSVPVLYLIDEIFRGTNNRERLIGSRAYIEALSTCRAGGLISTHDLELAEIPKKRPGMENVHFRETIENGQMHFTYKMSEGPCPSTNALRIMELNGLPIAT